MKVLIGLLSAHHPSRYHYRDYARKTFLKDLPAGLDYKFVFGRPDAPTTHFQDELFFDCPDQKEFMVLKDKGLFQFAILNGYDFCFRACDDTFMYPGKLLTSDLEKFDYAGMMPCKINVMGVQKVWMPYFAYMHGGCGMWLSKKAMIRLSNDPWKGPQTIMPEQVDIGGGLKAPGHKVYWDDQWIGEVLMGNLAMDDPKRKNPVQCYRDNGITVLEDDIMFENSDKRRVISRHDPGLFLPGFHMERSDMEEDLIKQMKAKPDEVAKAAATELSEAAVVARSIK
jgi:hypothetical protein